MIWFRAQSLTIQAGLTALTMVSLWFAVWGAPALWAMAVPGTPIPLGMRMMGAAFVLMTSPALYLALIVQARTGGGALTCKALALVWLIFSAATFFAVSQIPTLGRWDPMLGVPALCGAALWLAVWLDRPKS